MRTIEDHSKYISIPLVNALNLGEEKQICTEIYYHLLLVVLFIVSIKLLSIGFW
jgi:hypothetical protein